MARNIEYARYGRNVRLALDATAKGHRIRWTDTDGVNRDTFRKTWDEAEALALELSGMIERKAARESADLSDQPIVHLFEDFMQVTADRKLAQPQTIRTRQSYLMGRVAPLLGDTTCGQWDREVTWKVVDGLRKDGLMDSTITSIVRSMSAAANFGVEQGYLPAGVNPCKGLKIGTARRQEPIDPDQLPNADQVQALVDATTHIDPDRPWRPLQLLLCAYSGLRVGEMLALHAEDIDLDGGTLKVQRQLLTSTGGIAPPKYGSYRTTIFPHWIDTPLAAHVERYPSGPLFPGARADYEPYSTYRNQLFSPARERAGWPRNDRGRHRWSIHTLRHYFCTWALSRDGLGLDVADVSAFAGHRDPSTTWSIYVSSRPDRAGRARTASKEAGR